MSQQAPIHFRESWKDGYNAVLQSRGALLLGTARRGDVDGKTVKFPIINKHTGVRKLTGALKPVIMSAGSLNTVQVDIDDYETEPYWIFTPDLAKIGANLKQAEIENLAMSVARSRDKLQLQAIADFTADSTTDHGGAAVIPNTQLWTTAKAKIAGTGAAITGQIYAGIPALWMEQLKGDPTFAKSTWVGDADLPLTKMSADFRTWNGINFMVLPDEYFVSPDGGTSLYAYIWHRDCIGVENNWGDLNTFEQVATMEGNPWMLKVGYGAAALGILRDGVRRIRCANITDVTAFVQLTKVAP